jgi:hypothetical protein
MTQTTAQLSAVNASIEMSPDSASWTDISGHANIVTVPDQTRETGFKYTFDGDVAAITAGNRAPIEVDFKVLYTETGTDAFAVVMAAFEAEGGTKYDFRWTPKGITGVTTGNFQFATGLAIISSFTYPSQDASDAAPIMVGWKVMTSKITKSAMAAS